MMDERTDARTDGQTDGRTWATLNALPNSTNGGGIKNDSNRIVIWCMLYYFLRFKSDIHRRISANHAADHPFVFAT